MKEISLKSITISSFTLTIIVLKKRTCQESASFPQATQCLWNLKWQNQGKPAFSQPSNCVTYWNAQLNPTPMFTELLSIKLKNEILKASSKYILSEFFGKADFSHLFKVFYRVLWSDCIFSKIWLMLRYWHMSLKIVFAIIISGWRTCKMVQDRSSKNKKSKGYYWK